MSEAIDVKAIREALNMTQADFAAAVGTDQGTVSTWETRRHKPGRLARRAIEKLLAEKQEAA